MMWSPFGAEIKFEEVSRSYGGLIALAPTTLHIKPGEFFALLGPSGSGKTTLLSIAAGFIAPSEGRVLVNGMDVTGVPPERRNIGMVFQNYSLFPFLSVSRNVAFPLEMRGFAKKEIEERVDRILNMVRLSDLRDRFPSQLSGGQQQRVALARAAVYDPPLLLMDEPLGALDKNLRDEMQEEIKQFHAKVKATVIYVTHDQQESAHLADRTAILNNGGVVQCGSQQELYEAPINSFVARFLGEANILKVKSVQPEGDKLVRVHTIEGLVLTADKSVNLTGELVVCIRPEEIEISSVPLAKQNVLNGRIVEVMLASEAIRYKVQIGNQYNFVIRSSAKRGNQRFSSNEEVFVGWDASEVRVIPSKS
jgi:putative spermidine/putrescine transport system ATP-binding protein